MSKTIGLWLSIGIMGALASRSATAATLCVDTAQGLRDALTIAQANGVDDTIKLVRGTYAAGGTPFFYDATEANGVDIIGGYNSDCSARIRNPALTVLDGGGTSLVFGSESTQGEVALRFVTIQHGLSTTLAGAGLRMNFSDGSNGSITVDQTIIRNNHAGVAAFSLSAAAGGTLEFVNNLIVDNVADIWPGGPEIYCGGGAIHVINNTFANNTVNSDDPRTVGGLVLFGPQTAIATLSNNIFWGNTAFGLASANAILIDNDYGDDYSTPAAGSSGNHHFNPQFAGDEDFHLSPTSPLLGIGTTTPVGGLPSIDIEGHPRTWLATVDLGPYERGDEIFADGYE